MVRTDLRGVRRILAATGVGMESVGGVMAARKLATALGAHLHAAHVIEPINPAAERAIPGLAEAHVTQAREELGKFASSHGLDRDCTLHVIKGRAVDEIIRLGVRVQADLLVVGRYGEGGLKRGVVGSVADALARKFPTSVLIVPPEYRGSFARIGAATDFSDDSWLALKRAAELAHVLSGGSAEVAIAHAYTVPAGYERLCTWEDACRRIEHASKAEADEVLARLGRESPGVRTRLVVREGTPAKTIVKWAGEERLDLLVLSTHGRTRAAATFLGRTTEGVIRAAPCAVWAEKSGTHVQTLLDAIRDLLK